MCGGCDTAKSEKWATAEYGSPAISRTGDAVLITGEGPPSGLYFRRSDLAPGKSYRLEISGEFRHGAPTLRIQRDDREFEYRAAPDGKLELDILETKNLEVLIYGDRRFSYRTRLSLSECAECASFPDVVGWKVAKYGTPTVASTEKGMTISGNGTPSGIYFRRSDLDKQKNYELQLSGQLMSGTATIRLRRDDAPFEYMATPERATPIMISGVERLEVLIYADSAFAYQAGPFSLRECERSLDGQLKLAGWNLARCGEPIAGSVDDVIQMSGSNRPAGIYFHRDDLDKGTTYRLQVTGFERSGSPILRVRIGEGEFRYIPAPEGELELDVSGAKRLEVLVFGDSQFSYQARLRLRECWDCLDEGRKLKGWSLAKYGEPIASLADDKIELSSYEGPAGIYFRRDDLDKEKTYHLRIAGLQRMGASTLRMQRDGGTLEYMPAPAGELELYISGTIRLELLIYGDSRFSYEAGVQLRECSDCLSDEGLKEIIRAAIPGLEETLKTDRLAAAHKLVKWTARTVDLGASVPQFPNILNAFPIMSAAQLYESVWKANAGGALCGGFAVFFQKVLGLFGIDAFTIDTGFPGTRLTHVTTVLPSKIGSTTSFHIFDPTFGGTYMTRDGRYADLRAMLSQAVDARFVAGPVRRTAIVSGKSVAAVRKNYRKLGLNPKCRRSEKGPGGYVICDHLAFDVALVKRDWAPLLRKNGVSSKADLILALMKQRVISSAAPADLKTAFEATLSESRVTKSVIRGARAGD